MAALGARLGSSAKTPKSKFKVLFLFVQFLCSLIVQEYKDKKIG